MSLHGSAQWASYFDLRSHGMTKPGGLFLGRSTWSDIHHHGSEHILTVAPPGSGKTSNLLIPALLSYRGSVVVTDPKAELAPMTIDARRAMGQRVVVLNPWRHELQQGGIDLPDTGFNPLGFLRDDYSLSDNVRFIGNMICPTKDSDKDPFFADAARALLSGFLLYMVKSGQPVTLPKLRELVRMPRAKMADAAEQMGLLAERIGAGELAGYADEILSGLESERTWSSIQRHAANVTDIYSAGTPLGDHVSHDDFNPLDLKHQDVSVYIVVPQNRRDDAKNWFSLVLAMFGEAVGKAGAPKDVLFLAEEFGNIGMVGNIGRMLAEYRAAGLRCWLVCQTMQQLDIIYGRQTADHIRNLCAIKQFFSVSDPILAAAIERELGKYTESVTSSGRSYANEPKTWNEALFGRNQSYNTSQIGVPLIRADEIMRRPKDRQIIIKAGMEPIDAKLVYYKDRPEWAAAARPSPYDRGGPSGSGAAETWRSEPAMPATTSQKLLNAVLGGGAAFIMWAILMEMIVRSAPSAANSMLPGIAFAAIAAGAWLGWKRPFRPALAQSSKKQPYASNQTVLTIFLGFVGFFVGAGMATANGYEPESQQSHLIAIGGVIAGVALGRIISKKLPQGRL